jgi:hypothetical protein
LVDLVVPGAGIRGKEPAVKGIPQTDERRHSEALHGCTVLVVEVSTQLVSHPLLLIVVF